MFFKDGWNIPNNLKEIVYVFILFGFVLGLSYLYTPSPEYGLMKIIRFNTFALTMFLTPILIIKTPDDSKAQVIIRMFPSDANPAGNVFGGVIGEEIS